LNESSLKRVPYNINESGRLRVPRLTNELNF